MNEPQSTTTSPSKSVPLPSAEEKYARLLAGAPETAGIAAGCVTLSPGESVGRHSTGDHEEVIVPLAGTGEMSVDGMDNIPVQPGCILYNPPHTAHNVINTGDQPLRYIYIVARA